MADVESNIWNRLTRVVVVLLGVAGVLLLAVCYLPLIKTNERMRKEVYRLDAKVAKEEETSRQLKTSIEALRNDSKAVERMAREKLGYAKPGETVIRFEESAASSTASR